jgi:WD40 repeat protein
MEGDSRKATGSKQRHPEIIAKKPKSAINTPAYLSAPKCALAVVFSCDGQWLAYGDQIGEVVLVGTDSGRELWRTPSHLGFASAVAFSPDGSRVVSVGTDRKVNVHDTATGTQIVSLREHLSKVSTVGFSADGKTLVTGDGKNVVIRRTE